MGVQIVLYCPLFDVSMNSSSDSVLVVYSVANIDAIRDLYFVLLQSAVLTLLVTEFNLLPSPTRACA